MTWAVSQGTSLRRMHVKGSLNLADQQRSLLRAAASWPIPRSIPRSVPYRNNNGSPETIFGETGPAQNWNMVFVGVSNPPSGTWPRSTLYTVITNTPLIREKPYLYVDGNTNFFVMVPDLETNSLGTTWAKRPNPRSFSPHQPVLSGATGSGQCRQPSMPR